MCHRLRFRLAGFVLFAIACGLPSAAVAEEPEIAFDPPLAVVIRKTDGTSARGRLLRLDAEQATLRILNGSEIELPIDRVRLIQASGGAAGTFEYRPADEAFEDLAARSGSVPGAKVSGAVARSVARTGNGAGARQANRRSAIGNSDDDDDRRGFRVREPVRPRDEKTQTGDAGPNPANPFGNLGRMTPNVPAVNDPAANEPTGEEPDATPAPGTVILVCSNCEKDLPAGFRSGSACPHCGEIAVFEEESAQLAANDAAASPQNPFAAPGGGAAPAPVAPVTPAPARQNPVATGGQGFSMSNMPLIAKVGIFAAFVVVGWLVLQRR
jgi:hypothetical protein